MGTSYPAKVPINLRHNFRFSRYSKLNFVGQHINGWPPAQTAGSNLTIELRHVCPPDANLREQL